MVNKEVVEHYTWGEQCDGWHLVNSPGLSIIQERMPAGASEERHLHARSRQFFFVLSGALTMEVDGRRELLQNYQGIEIAPGVPHRVFNESDHAVEFIVVSQPHSHGDRIPA